MKIAEEGFGSLIDEVTWSDDKSARADPRKLTDWFHRSVPILKHLDWSVTDTGFGSASTVLPLNVQSTNQHIAHQAALILIAADYTGGIALGTCLTGTPLVGIHPQTDNNAAYLWGAKAEIRWIKPSTDDLHCRARLSRSQIKRVRERYFSGKRVLESVQIDLLNRSETVATANITYWVQDIVALRKNALNPDRIHVLFDHKTKVSAKLIAGLRALEQRRPSNVRLFNDPAAQEVAGKHGITIAERFVDFAPQLQRMVAARTHVLDRVVARLDQRHPWQVVNIGSGLDTRFGRLDLPAGSRVFHLDLPHMLGLRRDHLKEPHGIEVQYVPFDIHTSELGTVLSQAGGFDSHRPSLFIWEGGSMYFSALQSQRLLRQCRDQMSPRSQLWLDFVDTRVVDGTHTSPIVQRFVSEMRSFGEPFVSGFGEIGSCLEACGLRLKELIRSSAFAEKDLELFDCYGFAHAMAS